MRKAFDFLLTSRPKEPSPSADPLLCRLRDAWNFFEKLIIVFR
jgi:hypothetical protein